VSGELGLEEATDLSQLDYVIMMMMIRICPRSKVGHWTQWQWDAMGNVYLRVIQLSALSMPRPHSHTALNYVLSGNLQRR